MADSLYPMREPTPEDIDYFGDLSRQRTASLNDSTFKTVITISSGAILLSVTFLEKFKGQEYPLNMILIWLFFWSTIFLGVVSRWAETSLNMKGILMWDYQAGRIHLDNKGEEIFRECLRLKLIHSLCVVVSNLSFLMGMLSVAILGMRVII